MQGGPANNATAGKVAQTVSLELAPEQVKKITVAEHLGKLSLAVRSAVEQQDTGDTDTYPAGDVSPEISPPECNYSVKNTRCMVHAGAKVQRRYVSQKQIHAGYESPEIAGQSATVMVNAAISSVKLPEKQ